jgi:hypothetical protein
MSIVQTQIEIVMSKEHPVQLVHLLVFRLVIFSTISKGPMITNVDGLMKSNL